MLDKLMSMLGPVLIQYICDELASIFHVKDKVKLESYLQKVSKLLSNDGSELVISVEKPLEHNVSVIAQKLLEKK